ncbi:hypothetical protein [uncultured Chryseobacterium sp.]|uniref:hypothetical protein n=1 Tax=uncultured Chryseobacterium sp. TaxID=259322 RepID=UPI0025DE68C5|nr:hypothetical protein [uncultured Chryseobacterium sp.]
MKNITSLILLIFIVSCNKKLHSSDKKLEKISYKNLDKIGFLKNNKKTTFCVKGYDLYQSRYVIPFDEKDDKILTLYKLNSIKDITTIFSFSNITKDTIYSFPIKNPDKFPVFGEKYKNSKNGHIDDLIKVYFKVYSDKKLGKIAVIDSIR